jgi:hypothetical protein
MPQTVVRGIDSVIDVPSKVLTALGLPSPAEVQLINPVGLAAGLSVTSSNDGNTLTLSASPSSDGLSKDSIFLKVSSRTQNGTIQKTVRFDCTVSAFAPPSGIESFSLELSVPGTPNQENTFDITQLLPSSIAPDPQFQYRIVDFSQLTSKGIGATLSSEGQMKVSSLADFVPGRYQAIVEMRSGSRTVYGTLWVNQSGFTPPETTFEVMVELPIGGQLRNPVNLLSQMPSVTSATTATSQTSTTTTSLAGSTVTSPSLIANQQISLEQVYNSSKRGVSAYISGSDLVQLSTTSAAYLGKNIIYLKAFNPASNTTSFGKLNVFVRPARPDHVDQEVYQTASFDGAAATINLQNVLEAPLAHREDLDFSVYSAELPTGMVASVTPNGLLTLYAASSSALDVTKGASVHLAARETSTGTTSYVTVRIQFDAGALDPSATQTTIYLNSNTPALAVDLVDALFSQEGAVQVTPELSSNPSPAEISAQIHGRYVVIRPLSTSQPGTYTLQFRNASASQTQARSLIIQLHGDAFPVTSSPSPYVATADWDSPSPLQLVSSSGTVSLKLAANQAQNFLRGELSGGAVKFYVNRNQALPGTYKVRVTDPRSPQMQLNVDVSIPHSLFAEPQQGALVARQEVVEGVPQTSFDLRALFPQLGTTSNYSFSILSSLAGNPLRATVTPAGLLSIPDPTLARSQSLPSFQTESEYFAVRGGISWTQAKDDAEKRGGHLATITSNVELQKMIQQVGFVDGLWLGGTDEGSEGKWRWVTGEPWSYQNWGGGEPNNAGVENYLVIGGGNLWNDANGWASGYVLEVPLQSVYILASNQGGSPQLLRLDVASRAPLVKDNIEVPFINGPTSVDLNLRLNQLPDIGSNRSWEMVNVSNGASNSGVSLSASGVLQITQPLLENHITVTARVRDLTSNKSAIASFEINSALPSSLEIIRHPRHQSANSGSRILLSTDAISPVRDSERLSYQWRRNGEAIPGAVFSAYTFVLTNESKGLYDVTVSDGQSVKSSTKALIDTDDSIPVGHLAAGVQTVVLSGTATTLQLPSAGFKIRQVVLNPTLGLSSVSSLAAADLILSLPSNDPRVSSTYILYSPTLNHYGDGESGHYAGKIKLPKSEPSYAIKAEGTLFVPAPGIYTFGVNSDDGSRITIDGTAVMTDDTNHGAQDFLSQPVTLSAGLHTVEVVMFEGGGGDHVEFFAAPGAHSGWNDQFSLVGSPQGLKVFMPPGTNSATTSSTQTTTGGSTTATMTESIFFDEGWIPGMRGNAGEMVGGSALLTPSSGTQMIRLQGDRNDVVGFPVPWKPSSSNGTLFFDVYIPADSNSTSFMLQVNSRNGWEHRAVWGDMNTTFGWGTANTESRKKVGELPPKGQWSRLVLPLSALGITASDFINELAFSQPTGLLYIDRVGYRDNPPFQWLKDGQPVAGANSSALKLTSVSETDEGVYTLVVSNGGASVSSSSMFLLVRDAVWDPSDAMHPLLQPVATQFRIGSSLSLSALVSGPLDVRYEWRKNGQLLPITTADFKLNNANEGDAGTYSVAAVSDNTLRRFEFVPVNVSVFSDVVKPSFPLVSAPRNIQLNVQSPLNLTDSASGTDIKYSWLKNGQPLPNAQSNQLFIPSVSVADAGQYVLVATNSAGSASSEPFTVSVATPPIFSESGQPRPLSVLEGQLLELFGFASGAGAYQWFIDGKAIPEATSNSYRVLKAASFNAGIYKLVATSPSGLSAESKSVQVDVLSQPVIRIQPVTRFVPFGSLAVFSVDATGTGPLTFKWLKNNQPIPNAVSNTLVINSASETDAGFYSVSVSNAYGAVQSSEAQLAIAPTIRADGHPKSPRVRLGESFSLNVDAVGTGTLSYQWFKNGTPIQGSTSKSLSINQPNTSDEGVYQVEVKSLFGSVTSKAVPVGYAPALVSDLPELITAPRGSDVLLSSNFSGTEPLKYVWSKDGVQLTKDAPLFSESFGSYLGNQNAKQFGTGLRVAHSGLLRGWSSTGSNSVHAVERLATSGQSDWAVMIFKDNVLTSPELEANTVGRPYRVEFETSPAVYAAPEQGTINGDGLVFDILRRDGTIIKSFEQLTGSWRDGMAFAQRRFDYQGDGSGPIRIRISSSRSLVDDRFKGALDNLSVFDASFSGPVVPLRSLQSLNAGTYQVSASNAFGLATSRTLQLLIKEYPPVIKSQSQSVLAAVGSEASLSVIAQSDLPISYQWFRNGVSLTGNQSPQLTFKSVSQADLGEYFVVVSNAVGEVTSEKVRVDAPPSFPPTQDPQNLKFQEGERVTLSPTVFGSAPMTFQWFKNGQPILGATAASLVFQSVTPNDDGDYALELKNAHGTLRSASTKLSVSYRLKVSAHPAPVTANTGTSVLFSVTAASSYGPIKYQWRRNSRPIPGAVFPVFGLESISSSSQGLYDVVVSDSQDSINSTAASLSVSDLFSVRTVSPTPHAVLNRGESFSVSVEAPANSSLQWRRNGVVIPPNTKTITVTEPGLYDVVATNALGRIGSRQLLVSESTDGSKGFIRFLRTPVPVNAFAGQLLSVSTYAISSSASPVKYTWSKNGLQNLDNVSSGLFSDKLAQVADSGSFSVTATAGELLSAPVDFSISVSDTPTPPQLVEVVPSLFNLVEGAQLLLNPRIIGSAPLAFEWSKDGKPLTAKTPEFARSSVSRIDSGVYTLKASNPHGELVVGPVTVNVVSGPVRIVSAPKPLRVALGAGAAFAVEAIGSEPMEYQWSKNGVVVPGQQGPTLQIAQTNLNSAGNYEVRVSYVGNPASVVTAAATLNVEPPPQITGIKILPTPNILNGVARFKEGSVISLSLSATGVAPLKYRWQRSGVSFGPDSAEVTPPPLTVADSGLYTVAVESFFGSVVSDPIQIRVIASPKITKQPKVLVVREGSPLNVAIEAQSTEPLTFRWRKDNSALEGEVQPAIRKAQSVPADAGLYSVSVTDGVSETVSEPIQVVVAPEFEIKANPASLSAVSNQDVELFVVTDSLNPLRYQWFKNNAEISGAVGVSLRIKSVSSADTADYFVRVTSAVTSKSIDSKSAQLVVDAPLTFAKDLESTPRNIGLNEPVSLDVQASGSGSLRYRWEVSDDNGPWVTQLATGPRLSLAGSPKEVSRRVRVSVTNGGPNPITSQTAVLNVSDIPAIIGWTNPQLTRVGAKAEMSITATGSGVQVEWTRGAIPQTTTRVETLQGATKYTLTIPLVSASDAGTYTASLVSPRSTIPLVKTFELLVNESPFQITKQPSNIVVREGQAGRISVGFESGTSDLSFQWKKNGIPVAGQTSPVFNLFKAKVSDEGSYTLEVSSKVMPTPVESDPAVVTIETTPTILLQPQPVVARETTSAGFEVLARGSVNMSYQWYYSKGTAGAPRQAISSATTQKLELSGVSQDQAGIYWVEVSNSMGTVASTQAKLDVVPALNITSLPKSVDTVIGETATLAVGVESLFPDSLRFQWYRLPLSQNPSAPSVSPTLPSGAQSIPGADKSTLLIESISADDSAEYLVDIADSSARKVVRGAVVRAISPPSIEKLTFSVRSDAGAEPTVFVGPMENVVVGLGNLIDLKVTSSGSLPATATVTIDGQSIASAVLDAGSSSIAFKALKQHTGTLKVKLANLAGTAESDSMTLTVSDSLKIVSQPQSTTTDAQSRVELSVQAIGRGKLAYRWTRNGAAVLGGSSSKLVLPRVAVSDAGVYQVNVSDGISEEISAGAVLELRTIILLQPQTVVTRVGQPARLRFELSSDEYEIQWMKAGVAVQGATSSILEFASVKSDDFSTYQATITHRVSREEIKTAEVSITEAPDFAGLTVEGVTQVKSGSSINLSVPASYLGVLQGAKYQWFKNFLPISNANSSALLLNQASSLESGIYTVQVTSAFGSFMSLPFPVAVNESDLLFHAEDIQISPGGQQSLNLESFDKASVGFFSFDLLPHSNRLGASIVGRNLVRFSAPAGIVGVTETFEVKVFGAGGLYLGKGRFTVSVPAGSPPVILQHPTTTGVPQGGSASLNVQASGGALRYQWRVNGTNVSGANSPVLFAKAADGQYDCVVTNEAGSVVSAPASVFEVDTPRFTTHPTSVKGLAVGSNASLWVSVASSYPVVYQWFKDGVSLLGQTERVLNIAGFTPSDEGAYTVTATNKFGVFAESEPASLSLSDSSIRIIAQPLSQSVIENSSVTLQVVAKGPQLSYTWLKETASGFAKVGDARVLTFPTAESGTYVCEVSSPVAGTVRSVPATVRVLKSEFSVNDTKLSDKRVSLMDSVALGVSVIGEGSFRFQWMKNGLEIDSPAARRDTLVIQQVTQSDAGMYSVKVLRGAEPKESKSVQLSIASPLVFLTQPELSDSTAYVGQSPIELFAEASSKDSAYQWRKNGIAIPKATTKKFTLKPDSAADSGTYDVIASTTEGGRVTGRVASQPVFLRVIPPLKITSHPKSVIANPGDGLALEVSTDGGAPSYQWLFKKLGSAATLPIEGQNLSRLEIASVSTENEGTYWVRITSANQGEIISAPASVKINKPVVITKNTSVTPVILSQGKSVTLQIAATGTPPLRYQWRKDGVPVANATNQRLVVTNSKKSASATYDCVVTNVVGPVVSNASPVVMAGRLEIADQPNPTTILNPGESFIVALSLANPTGSEKIQWYRTLGKTTRAITGATAPTLSIPSVKEDDEAAYFAVVSGPVKLTSKLASLKVNRPVRFVSQSPSSTSVIEGRDISLSVQVSGTATKDVPITFQWFYNGAVLPGARSSSLLIKNAPVNASGVYSVTAENIAGKVSSNEFSVTVSPGISFSKIYALVNGTPRAPQPIVTENPSSVLQPVKFKLAVDVTPGGFNVEYRWRVNGRRILSPSAETAVLDFDSLGQAEAGEYDVIITSKDKLTGAVVNETTVESVRVVVNEPVIVTVPPISQGRNTGAQVELRTEARGAGLSYQWMKFNPVTMAYEPLLGATSPALPITVDEQTQGRYKVSLAGTVNQVELSEINVWLLDSVRFEKQPENLTAVSGTSATFTVDARKSGESSGTLSYRWRKNRATTGLVSGQIISIDVVQPGSGYRTAPAVEIVPTGSGSGATAVAEMELDASGETFSVARVVVTNGGSGYESAPEVRIAGEIQANLEGTIGQQALAGVFAAPSQQSSPELTLPKVSEADEGEYYVEVFDGAVDDSAPRLTSSVVRLTVKGEAKIDMQPTQLTAVEGRPFQLNVLARGNNAVYRWTKSSTTGTGGVPDEFVTETPSVLFDNIKESDAGTYQLTVSTSNPASTVISKDIQVKVIALPKELSLPEPLLEKNPLESFYFEPRISVAPQGQTFFYQWFKNDREIIGAVGRTLFINQVGESDEGRYRLEVYSEAGILKASPVDLSVNDVPRVIAPLENITVEPDAPFALAVSALGKDLAYQWYLNGVAIPDAQSSTYSVERAINGETEGVYSVVISSSTRFGGVGEALQTSAKAIVTVKDPTLIVRQPSIDEVSGVNLNSSRTWTVEAQGTNLQYQWQKNGTDIPGAVQKTYRVGGAQPSDEGVYRVVVTGDLGVSTSNDFVLEINKAPSFISQPRSAAVVAGETLEVVADVTGSSPIKFQWRKDGRPVAGQTGSSLKLSSVSNSEAGTYDVIVSNPVGSIRSAPFRVTVMTPPNIVTEPTSIVVIPGESPSLSVVASGVGTLTYQWFKDGEVVEGANEPLLRLQTVSAQSDGRYSVSVSNDAGSVFSQAAKLTVLSPVVITSQPTNARALLRGKASLSVEVSEASLPVSYQWRKGGTLIPSATSKTLSFASVQASDAADYDVIITNDAGSVTSTAASLVIDSALVAPTLPNKLTVNQGSGASISVAPIGEGPFTFQWRKNGQPLVGATDDVLVFEFASVTDTGSYDVVVSNPSSSVTSSKTEVQVIARINIAKQPASVLASANDSVSLSVQASASGALSYQWRKNGVNLSGATSPSLQLTVSTETIGVYDVLISENSDQSVYSVLSAAAAVELSSPIRIVSPPKNLDVFQGDGAAFDVIATGTGKLTYSWSLAGRVLPNETSHRLVIPQVTTKPPATLSYSVTVSDGKTSETATATVTVSARPSVRTQAAAPPIAQDASVNLVQNSPVRAYLIEARPVAGAAPFEGRLYLDAETESAVISEGSGGVVSAFRAPEAGVTLAPALTAGELEVLKLEFRSDSGLESWSLQGPANLVASQADGSWMAHTLVGLRKVYDTTGKLIGTWMVSVQFQESVPAMPPAISGASTRQ